MVVLIRDPQSKPGELSWGNKRHQAVDGRLNPGRIGVGGSAIHRFLHHVVLLTAMVSLNCVAAGTATPPVLDGDQVIEVVRARAAGADPGIPALVCQDLSDWVRKRIELLALLSVKGKPVGGQEPHEHNDKGECSPFHVSIYLLVVLVLTVIGCWLGYLTARPEVRRISARRKQWREERSIPFME